jgi:hypothetical protein
MALYASQGNDGSKNTNRKDVGDRRALVDNEGQFAVKAFKDIMQRVEPNMNERVQRDCENVDGTSGSSASLTSKF